jgi:hypothetical protein
MHYGTHQQVRAALQALGLSGRLNTAFVERVNLTVRQSVAALARRTWSTALDAPQLLAHLQWWRGYYHFVRPHASLRIALAQPCARGGRRQPRRYRHRTPAMAAGLTRHRWAARDLLALPLPPEPISERVWCEKSIHHTFLSQLCESSQLTRKGDSIVEDQFNC